jgi:hypothetical protein
VATFDKISVLCAVSAVAVFGCLAPAPAHAEPWCHDIPVGPNGQTKFLCESRPVQSPSHFAAIYYDDVTSAIGSSWGHNSEAAANQAALRACRAYGGGNCQWAASGQNRCLALAMSSNGAWAADLGNYPETAKAKAISACRKNGGINCQVPASAHPCSED